MRCFSDFDCFMAGSRTEHQRGGELPKINFELETRAFLPEIGLSRVTRFLDRWSVLKASVKVS